MSQHTHTHTHAHTHTRTHTHTHTRTHICSHTYIHINILELNLGVFENLCYGYGIPKVTNMSNVVHAYCCTVILSVHTLLPLHNFMEQMLFLNLFLSGQFLNMCLEVLSA